MADKLHFSLVSPLLSRCLLLRLEPLSSEEIRDLMERARVDRERGLGAFDVNVYVRGDTKAYRAIHPEAASSASIAVGTVIVREVFDAQGQLAKLTRMAKGPSGYDPTLGDWWFGEATPDGNPVRLGRLTDCHGCHEPRAAEDFLFGVPKALEGH